MCLNTLSYLYIFFTKMTKFDWNRELTTALIQQYESYPCLYDTKNKFNSNKHARNDSLIKITGELLKIEQKVEVDDVKKKITNLRQQFSHERTKINSCQKSGVGVDNLYEPTVWWYEKLLFLVPYLKTRTTKSSLDYLESQTQSSENGEFQEEMSVIFSDSDVSVTPQTTKKRKYNECSDPIINKTISTLQILEKKLENPCNCNQQIPKSNVQIFADYVAIELEEIDNDELRNEAQHQINNILYETKKKWFKAKTDFQNNGILLLDNNTI